MSGHCYGVKHRRARLVAGWVTQALEQGRLGSCAHAGYHQYFNRHCHYTSNRRLHLLLGAEYLCAEIHEKTLTIKAEVLAFSTSLYLRETLTDCSVGRVHWCLRSADHNSGDVHHALVKMKILTGVYILNTV